MEFMDGMKPTSPWSVKGIDPEAREAAKLAARKAGVSLGTWLNHTIRAAATKELKRTADPDYIEQPGYDYRTYGPTMAPASAAPGPARTEGPTPHDAQPPAPTLQAIFESVQKLTNRLETTETRTTEAIEPIVQKVDELANQIEKVQSRTDLSTAPVERAVMRIADRLQKLEETQPAGQSATRFGLFSRLRRS